MQIHVTGKIDGFCGMWSPLSKVILFKLMSYQNNIRIGYVYVLQSIKHKAHFLIIKSLTKYRMKFVLHMSLEKAKFRGIKNKHKILIRSLNIL